MKRLRKAMKLNDAQVSGIAMCSFPSVCVAAYTDHAVWLIPLILCGLTLIAMIANFLLDH